MWALIPVFPVLRGAILMKSISQVAKLTGVSIRTLQYYDEIGLLKPSKLTTAGYRMYDDNALQALQQILFFKELGFPLKEIKEILEKPDFDRIAAFKKQKELFLLKRDRLNRLIQLLERLEKGEQCMSFKEFDLSDYINALEDFKSNQTETVIQHWGSIENFDMFIQKIRDDETEIAKLAIKQFGSIEKYTETMKYNLDHFSEIMDAWQSEEIKEIMRQSDLLYGKLTADLTESVSSPRVQGIVHDLLQFAQQYRGNAPIEKPYIQMLIDTYSNDYTKEVTDSKYGKGAANYIVEAFRYYSENNFLEIN